MSLTFTRFNKSLNNWISDDNILELWNLLIEFDRNPGTSSFKEFVKNYEKLKSNYK